MSCLLDVCSTKNSKSKETNVVPVFLKFVQKEPGQSQSPFKKNIKENRDVILATTNDFGKAKANKREWREIPYKVICIQLGAFFVFSFVATIGLCAQPTTNDGVDIFIGGKKFDTIKDYKQYRINSMREKVLKEMKAEDKQGKTALKEGTTQEGAGQDELTSSEFNPATMKTITIVPKYYYSSGPAPQKSLADLLGDYLGKILKSWSDQEKKMGEFDSANAIPQKDIKAKVLQKKMPTILPSTEQKAEAAGLKGENLDRMVDELSHRSSGRLTKIITEVKDLDLTRAQLVAVSAIDPQPQPRKTVLKTDIPEIKPMTAPKEKVIVEAMIKRKKTLFTPIILQPALAPSSFTATKSVVPHDSKTQELEKMVREINKKKKGLLGNKEPFFKKDIQGQLPAIIIDRNSDPLVYPNLSQ